jgi:selenocysteine lyase/cysteine desulfurase
MFDEAGKNCYLDHPTTSWPKAPGVVDAVVEALTTFCASPGRSQYNLSRHAHDIVENVRQNVAAYLNCPHVERIILTPGATTSMNMALKGFLDETDHVIATSFDHNAALIPLANMRARGISVSIVSRQSPDSDFVDGIIRELRPSTKLLVINHASNVTGSLLPLEELIPAAHANGTNVLLDASQTIGHIPIDLNEIPVDLIAFGGHKSLLGPPGVGCLVVNNPDMRLRPIIEGGTGLEFGDAAAEPIYPISYECGTQNFPAIAGLGKALEFVSSDSYSKNRQKYCQLKKKCIERLSQFPHVKLKGSFGNHEKSVPVISFTVDGHSPDYVASILDERFNIQVRSGLHCAPAMHRALGTYPNGTVRIGFGFGNSEESVDSICTALEWFEGKNTP